MRMHTLPLAGLGGKALHDDLIVLKQILPWNIRIVEVLVLELASRTCRGRLRYRLESHQVHLDRCRTRIGAALVGGIRGVLPYDPTVSPERRAARRLGSQHTALDEHQQLIGRVYVATRRLTRMDNEFLHKDACVVEQYLALQSRKG